MRFKSSRNCRGFFNSRGQHHIVREEIEGGGERKREGPDRMRGRNRGGGASGNFLEITALSGLSR